MDWNWYLFSFEGRINRAKYWLSFPILMGWMLLVMWIMWLIMITALLATRAPHGNLFGMTVFTWICLATSVKRLHDRDRSGWWIVPFLVLPSFSCNIREWFGDSIFPFLAGLALFILCIWGFVELGFLRGTRRINRFGPDPLAEDEDARLRRSGLGSRGPAWDQQREIELAPHRASPMSSMHVKPRA